MATNCIVTQYCKYVLYPGILTYDLFSFRTKPAQIFLANTALIPVLTIYLSNKLPSAADTLSLSTQKRKHSLEEEEKTKTTKYSGYLTLYIRYAENEIMSKMRVEHGDLNLPVHSVCRNKHFLISRLFYWSLTLDFRFQTFFMNLKKNCIRFFH